MVCLFPFYVAEETRSRVRESLWPECLVIWNDDPGIGIMPPDDPPPASDSVRSNARRSSWPEASSTGAGREFNILQGILLRHRITGNAAILYVKVDGLLDVCERLRSGIALRDAARKHGNRYDITAVGLAFEDYCVLHIGIHFWL